MVGRKDNQSKGDAKDITLRDVVVHMEHMEQRLTSKIDEVDQRLSSKIEGVDQRLSSKLDGVGHRIDTLELNLTARIDALEEDLTATMKDTYSIRKHVGMVAADDE